MREKLTEILQEKMELERILDKIKKTEMKKLSAIEEKFEIIYASHVKAKAENSHLKRSELKFQKAC